MISSLDMFLDKKEEADIFEGSLHYCTWSHDALWCDAFCCWWSLPKLTQNVNRKTRNLSSRKFTWKKLTWRKREEKKRRWNEERRRHAAWNAYHSISKEQEKLKVDKNPVSRQGKEMWVQERERFVRQNLGMESREKHAVLTTKKR